MHKSRPKRDGKSLYGRETAERWASCEGDGLRLCPAQSGSLFDPDFLRPPPRCCLFRLAQGHGEAHSAQCTSLYQCLTESPLQVRSPNHGGLTPLLMRVRRRCVNPGLVILARAFPTNTAG